MQHQESLNWVYCECGCHGHELKLGPLYFWLFNDLGRGKNGAKSYHLYAVHGGTSGALGSYSTPAAVTRVVRFIEESAQRS